MKKIIIATVGGIILFGSGFCISNINAIDKDEFKNIKAQNERHVKELDKLKIDLEKTNKELETFKKENKIEDPKDDVTKEDNKDSNEKNKHEEMNQILKDNRTLRDQQFLKEDQEKKQNHNNSKPVHKEKPIKPELPTPPKESEKEDSFRPGIDDIPSGDPTEGVWGGDPGTGTPNNDTNPTDHQTI